jgi:hypothetical protein
MGPRPRTRRRLRQKNRKRGAPAPLLVFSVIEAVITVLAWHMRASTTRLGGWRKDWS